MHKLLLVEDDEELSNLLIEFLEPDGFDIQACYNGNDALMHANTGQFDLIILDIMLPGLNGTEVLRQIRTHSSVPIIMLTARGDEIDRIVGLEMGADDYLPKPCNPRELLARIKAILRRAENTPEEDQTDNQETIKIDDVELHPKSREAFLSGTPLELTSAEFNILEILLRNAGQVIKKNILTEQALARNMTMYDRSIDVHISKLRMKLGPHGDDSLRIKTVRGIGYIYVRQERA